MVGLGIATPMVAWLGRRTPLLPLTLRTAALHAPVAIIAERSVDGIAWTALGDLLFQQQHRKGALATYQHVRAGTRRRSTTPRARTRCSATARRRSRSSRRALAAA
jgi:hypothetical protein